MIDCRTLFQVLLVVFWDLSRILDHLLQLETHALRGCSIPLTFAHINFFAATLGRLDRPKHRVGIAAEASSRFSRE